MNSPASTCSIVIPVYNAGDTLRSVLHALGEQDGIARCDVIIVDDGSTDDSAAVARAELGSLAIPGRVITQENSGPAGARNAGIALASTPIVLLLDADVIPRPGLLRAHLKFHAERPDERSALIGPYWFEEIGPHRRFMRWMNRGGSPLVSPPWWQYRDNEPVPPTSFLTGNVSLKAPLLLRVGRFDEAFRFPAFEDVEMGARLGEAGMRLVYRSDAVADHRHVVSPESLLSRMRDIGYSSHLMQERLKRAPIHPGRGSTRPRRWVRRMLAPIGVVIRNDSLALGYWAQRLHDEFVAGFEMRAAELDLDETYRG